MLVCAGGLGHTMRCSFSDFLLPFFEPDLYALVLVFRRVFSRLSVNYRPIKHGERQIQAVASPSAARAVQQESQWNFKRSFERSWDRRRSYHSRKSLLSHFKSQEVSWPSFPLAIANTTARVGKAAASAAAIQCCRIKTPPE